MAIKKPIKQNDGVTTEYHRILSIKSTINNIITITVLSYIDEAARDAEIKHIVELPYQKQNTYSTEYVENMTIADAYAFLKLLPAFEGAEDIFDMDADEPSEEIIPEVTPEEPTIEETEEEA